MMPAFNAARFIEASLASVLEQDFDDFEVIVLDDGSTDRTVDVVARHAAADNRVRLYRWPRNRGVAPTRNAILTLARGAYLAPHDADDLMLPGRLAREAAVLDDHPQVGVVFAKYLLREAGETRVMVPYLTTDGRVRSLRRSQEIEGWPGLLHHGSAMLRRSVVLAAGGYDPRWEVIEDTELFRRLRPLTRFYFLNRCCFVYRRHRGSLVDRVLTASRRPRPMVSRAGRFRARLTLRESRVEVTSDDSRHLAVIRRELPHAFGAADRAHGIEFRIHIRSKLVPRRWVDLGLDRIALEALDRAGLCQARDPANPGTVSVLLDDRRSLDAAMIYHGAFLRPLSSLLGETRACLVHAALVARGPSGILIAGDSGCGKSTIALALVGRGYAYLGDEHPILRLRNGTVVGQSFVGRIGLPSIALRHFPDLADAFAWDAGRGKWYADPARVAAGRLGEECRIETVLFPRFRERGRAESRILTRLELLRRLTGDEYFRVAPREGVRKQRLRLLLRLVASARGVALSYGPADVGRLGAIVERIVSDGAP